MRGFLSCSSSSQIYSSEDEAENGVADSFLRSKSLSLITTVLTTIGIIVRIIYCKINAGSPPKAQL